MPLRQRPMSRAVAGVVLLGTIVSLSVVVYATYGLATMDYTQSMSQLKWDEILTRTGFDSSPWPTVYYRKMYPYSWLPIAVAVSWAAWILRKPTCSPLAVALYVTAFLNVALVWLLYTLVALYLKNQSFHM